VKRRKKTSYIKGRPFSNNKANKNVINTKKQNFVFEVLIDESFVNIVNDKSINPVENKHVLSLINDFENGNWRYSKFQSFIWNNIAETALSLKERESLIDQPHDVLIAAAKNLRLIDKDKEEKGKGSELAEIVLYGIMKNYYNALSVVPKIFYKQNPQDNAKGADSVHIVIENENNFSLWLGEAKFYNSIEDDRLGSIVQSVKELLETDKLKKENSIITNVKDLETLIKNSELKDKIKQMLSNGKSTDLLKPILHVPILLLHECEITKKHNSLTEQYKSEIIKYHKQRAESYFKKHLKKCNKIFKYSEIKFHIILFPVPDKNKIVDKFVSNVEHYKNQ